MTMLETIAVAFSMFSAIPMPQFLWNEKNMRYALCAFPLIGAVIGAVCWGAWSLCGLLGLPELLGQLIGFGYKNVRINKALLFEESQCLILTG